MAYSVWDRYSNTYKSLSQNSCICGYEETVSELFSGLIQGPFNVSSNEEKGCLELQLLSSEILRVVGEKYIVLSHANSFVCYGVAKAAEYIEELWELLVEELFKCENKYKSRSLVKALAANLYVLHQSEVRNKVKKMLDRSTEVTSAMGCANLLSLLKEAVGYRMEKQHICHPSTTALLEKFRQTCKRTQEVRPVPLSEIRRECCLELLPCWEKILTDDYCFPRVEIFELWKVLVEESVKTNAAELLNEFLSPRHVATFFEQWSRLDTLTFRVYVDVILQILSARLADPKQWQEEPRLDLLDFVTKVSSVKVISSSNFCGTLMFNNESQKEKYTKFPHEMYDVALMKKLTALVLYILSGVQDMVAVSSVLNCVQYHMLPKMGYPSSGHLSVWVPKLFLDHDDLLLGSMLSLLNLYVKQNLHLRSEECSRIQDLKTCLNPHRMFCELMSEIGYDHNVILEFLMSDETCILPYLMCYLKLMLSDWSSFEKSCKDSAKFAETSEYFMPGIRSHNRAVFVSTSRDVPARGRLSGKSQLTATQKTTPLASKLVCYSSSEGSDTSDSCERLEASNVVQTENMDSCIVHIMTSLKELRKAVERLCEHKEFPYNARPLCGLLKACENEYTK